MKRKRKPKEKVLRKWPDACPVYHATGFYAGTWTIEDAKIRTNCYSNHHRSAAKAWAEAARCS